MSIYGIRRDYRLNIRCHQSLQDAPGSHRVNLCGIFRLVTDCPVVNAVVRLVGIVVGREESVGIWNRGVDIPKKSY